MTLYLYKTGTVWTVLTLENVVSYTTDQAAAADGSVYGPFADDCELSATPDCTGTLRADWREAHPSQETRMDELEALVAALLFGGEAV